MLRWIQMNDSRLQNFGKSTLQIPCNGGTTKLTRKALSINGWSTPPWVKAMFNLAGEGKMQPRTKDYQDTTVGDRLSKGHNEKHSIVPTTVREYRHIVQGGGSGAKKFMRVEDMLGSNPTSLGEDRLFTCTQILPVWMMLEWFLGEWRNPT